MKYVCFGYLDAEKWAALSPQEQYAMIDRCFAYDETLKRNGNWVYGDGLQGPDRTVSLRYQKGKVAMQESERRRGVMR